MTFTKNNSTNLGILFEELVNQFPSTWGKDVKPGNTIPSANIYETNEGYQVAINAPGRIKEDFTIHQESGLLTIGYHRKEETDKTKNTLIREEFNNGSFKRSFHLDEKINTADIQAKYENGVLTVYLPKKEEVVLAPQKIAIQ